MVSSDPRAILPDPPPELKRLTDALAARIRARIARDGPMPFPAYMDMALYEPGLGYYSAGKHKFGAGGDFVTAPELGPLFARCLARQAGEIASQLGSWEVLEIGAGSGRLALDFLTALQPGCAPRRYRILERSAHLRQLQRECLAGRASALPCEVEWLTRPPESGWQGLLLANEVIDALSVERFLIRGGRIERLLVGLSDGHFAWTSVPAPAELARAVSGALGERLGELPDGYQSEICVQLPAWLEGVTERLERGVMLCIDYGYPRTEYYRPERAMGTLICHYRHRAHGDPFAWPGLQDISAFVDFTALAEAADSSALDCVGYASQAMFLFGCGLERLAHLPDLSTRERLATSQEIRTLTLPGEMGEKFQCMALARGFHAPLTGFSWQDLRRRL